MSLHIWYVEIQPYLGIVKLFTKNISTLSLKSFSSHQIILMRLCGRTILYCTCKRKRARLCYGLFWPGFVPVHFLLTELQLWQLWGHFEPLPLFISYCPPVLQYFTLIEHSMLCLWRRMLTMEKRLSWYAFVNVFLIPKSNIKSTIKIAGFFISSVLMVWRTGQYSGA